MRKYIDFKLYLSQAPGDRYQVSLLPTPEVGESIEPISFSIDQGAYAENQADLHSRQINNLYLLEVGRQLGDWLLPVGNIRDLFRQALTLAENKDGVRLRLIIAHPALKQIPWEYVVNPFVEDDSPFAFLALDPRISIVRHEPLTTPHPKPIQLPNEDRDLAILAATASPDGMRKLSTEFEIDHLRKRLAQRGDSKFDIRPKLLTQAGWENVTERLDRPGRYHIFHFAGHGAMKVEENSITIDDIDLGWLYFADEMNRPQPITAGAFADQMRQADIWMVTLGACQTGDRSAGHPWHSVAGALLARNIPVVVAMQNEIQDHAAVVFSREFYTKIQDGLSLDEAMSWSRRKMAADLLEVNRATANMEWGIPVLYSRLPDGLLVPEWVVAGSPNAAKAREAIQAEVEHVIRIVQETGEMAGENIGIKAREADFLNIEKDIDLTQKSDTVTGRNVGFDLTG